MIKATAMTGEGPLIVFGLSYENLARLKAGRPIKISMADLGGEGHVLIFAGETETAMAAELAEFVGPDTRVHGMKQ